MSVYSRRTFQSGIVGCVIVGLLGGLYQAR